MDYRMDYEQFVTLVEQDLGIGRERAERAIRSTLHPPGGRARGR
jgi:hypothetical protein